MDNIHVGINDVCTSVIEGKTQIQILASEFSNFKSNITASMREVMKGEVKAGFNDMCSFIGAYPTSNGDDLHEETLQLLPPCYSRGVNEMEPVDSLSIYSFPNIFHTVACMMQHYKAEVSNEDGTRN